MSIEGHGLFLTLAKGHLHIKNKTAGYPRSGKEDRGKIFFSRSGNFVSSQGILELSIKSGNSRGLLK